MRPSAHILLAEPDPDFRESMLNHLLLSGYANVDLATSADDFRATLLSAPIDILLVDCTLYCDERVKRAVDEYHRGHGRRTILLLDDGDEPTIRRVLSNRDIYVCLLKSSIGLFLQNLPED